MQWLQQPPDPIFRLFRLDRDELVRMNRRARSAPDLAGYVAWYPELSEQDQRALTCHLLRFECDYNDGSRWGEVLQAAGTPETSSIAARLGPLAELRKALDDSAGGQE